MKVWVCEKQEAVCAGCKHYYQHYVLSHGAFWKCQAGHCTYPRLKSREPQDGCKYFSPRHGATERRQET